MKRKKLIFNFCLMLLLAFSVSAQSKKRTSSKTEKKIPAPQECPTLYYYSLGEPGNYFVFLESIDTTPEKTIEKTDITKFRPAYKSFSALEEYNVRIVSYSTDSHKNFQDYLDYDAKRFYDLYGGDFEAFGRVWTACLGPAKEILDDLIPGKSHIITFVLRKNKYEILQDQGVIERKSLEKLVDEYESMTLKPILEKLEGNYFHLVYLKNPKEIRENYVLEPIVEDFNGDTANDVLHYGTAENLQVKIPGSVIAVNKNALPKVGLGDGSKVILENNYYIDTSVENLSYTLTNRLEMVAQNEISYQCLDLAIAPYKIYNLYIIKREGDYYLSREGWKVYVPDNGYKEYFDTMLKEKKEFCPNDDKICYKLCMLQNKGSYELVLEACPYTVKR